MHTGKLVLSTCLVLATAPVADAARKDPVPGSVTCYCACNTKDGNGGEMNYNKIIGGTEGGWTQSRSACQEYDGARCSAKDSNGKWHYGELKSCDTHVHSQRPGGRKPQAPTGDKVAPGTETQGGATNRLKLRVQPKLLTQ